MVEKFDESFKDNQTTNGTNGRHCKFKRTRSQALGTNAVNFLQEHTPDGPWVLTAITPDGPTCTRAFTDAEEARKFIVKQNRSNRKNTYYTINLCRADMASKPKKTDIAVVTFLHVDADPADDESPDQFKARIMPRIESFRPQPTFIIDTGNGIQLLWGLEQPVELDGPGVIADIEARNHALAEKFGANPSTRNVDRLFRCPGTINYPTAKKRKLGREECRARLLKSRPVSHPLTAFPSRQGAPKENERATGSSTELSQHLLTLLDVRGRGRYESRSELLLAFLRLALRASVAEDVIIAACLDRAYARGGIYQHVQQNGGQNYLARQITRAREKMSDPSSSKSIHSWEEPDVSLLDDRRGDLPTFPLDALFPDELQRRVELAAHGTGTSIDHVAVPLLGIASSLIGRTRRVRASSSWSQPMTCWTAVVAFSGQGKTPGIDATRKPLAQLEFDRREEIAKLKREHERRAELAKANKAKWKKDLDEAIKRKEPTPELTAESDEPGRFIEPKLYVSDVTIEKMAELLQARPQGMLVLIDELAGWFGSMNRYSGVAGQDNQFWLMCWDGLPYSMERKTQPSINIDHLLVGIVGGLQPDKLNDVFKGAADGMYARFLFAWPDKPPYRPLSDDIAEIDPKIMALLDRLARLSDHPVSYPLSHIRLLGRAKHIFERFRREVHVGEAILDGREREWWAKAPAHVLRLAGTLSMMRWAMVGTSPPTEIMWWYIKAAVRLVRDYFWPHARACLRQIGLSQRHADARRVLHWIMATGKQRVRREEIRRDALARQLNADETEKLLNHLERAGWLRKVLPRRRGRGRPKAEWQVNPRLFAQQG
jgi:hypothetical protein